MDRHHVDAGIDGLVAASVEPLPQLVGIGLDLLDQHDRRAALDRRGGPFERLDLHALDVELDQVAARQVEIVQRQLAHLDGVVGVVDGLADELGVRTLAQLQAAEARRRQVVRAGDVEHAALRRHRGMDGDRVEAVVDRDVAGESIIDPLLRLDRQHRSPAGHRLGPFDRVHADIGPAIDRHGAVAMVLAAHREHAHRELHLARIEGSRIQDLVADAIASVGIDHAVVEPVDDHRAVIAGGQNEGQLPVGNLHGSPSRVDSAGADAVRCADGVMQGIVRYDTAARGRAPQNPECPGGDAGAARPAAGSPATDGLIRPREPVGSGAPLRDQYLHRRREDHRGWPRAGRLDKRIRRG
ncbi:conserved hypothetical protein [Bradyrhizobium sp. STM 3809]|nr:conserved hypothetical protein [Bradyrhizobium sp. STM 3809]